MQTNTEPAIYFFMRFSANCFCIFLLMVFAAGCTPEKTGPAGREPAAVVREIPVKHSELLRITDHGSYKMATLQSPWQPGATYARYVLLGQGQPAPKELPPGAQLVRTPVKNLVTMSATHIGMLALLGLEHKIAGHSMTELVYHRAVRRRIEQGEVIETGNPEQINLEQIIELNPGLLMASGFEQMPRSMELLSKAGVPVVYNIEWMEPTPLGRAEWLKFVALFFEKSGEADSIFNKIEEQYLAGRAQAAAARKKPGVLVGNNYKGTWYLPGGRSNVAVLLKDAGAQYRHAADTSRGSLPLGFEAVLEGHLQDQYWINPGTATSIESLLQEDGRYANFTALQQGLVYNSNKKLTASGGNDYWESGMANPHLVLKDLIKILHPNLLPGYELVYFQKLSRHETLP